MYDFKRSCGNWRVNEDLILLKQKIVNGYSGSNDIELEINSFISGVYILLIEGNDFLIAEKIVIQKR